MIILITPEMNIIDYQFNLTSLAPFLLKKVREIRYSKFHMLDYVSLQTLTSCFKSISVNCIYFSTVRQVRLSSMAIIYIERSYSNRILQVLIDRIIDIFVKIKNLESFKQSVHALIILLYISLRTLVQ